MDIWQPCSHMPCPAAGWMHISIAIGEREREERFESAHSSSSSVKKGQSRNGRRRRRPTHRRSYIRYQLKIHSFYLTKTATHLYHALLRNIRLCRSYLFRAVSQTDIRCRVGKEQIGLSSQIFSDTISRHRKTFDSNAGCSVIRLAMRSVVDQCNSYRVTRSFRIKGQYLASLNRNRVSSYVRQI